MATIDADWSSLKDLRAWTPLSEIDAPTTHLGASLYRLAPTAYVTCVSYTRNLEEVRGALFVTMLVWAETDGAARRSQLMEVEADEHADVEPPPQMLLRGQPVTYGAILRELKRGNTPGFREWADYRAATDGTFVHRTISIPPLSFHFRRREADDSERCYAIQYRLP